MLKFIIKLFKALNSNSHPGEIAHAVCLGLLLGFLPKGNILWILAFIFIFFVRINKGAWFLMILACSFLTDVLDPFFDTVGWYVLHLPALTPVFTTLLDVPFVGFTQFNNTIVMGSLVVGLLAYIPLYILSRILIMLWRKYGVPVVSKSKLFKAFYKMPLISKIANLASKEF
jgi:uncharacterized protein (TIGR03546 family)